MTPSERTELEALRRYATTPLPAKKEDWPAYKELNQAVVVKVQESEAARLNEHRLKIAARIAREIENIAAFPWHPPAKRLELIAECVERLNHLMKGE